VSPAGCLAFSASPRCCSRGVLAHRTALQIGGGKNPDFRIGITPMRSNESLPFGSYPRCLLLIVPAIFLFWSYLHPAVAQTGNDPGKREWKQLFNGTNLDGWDVKIRGHAMNDNSARPFASRMAC